MPDRRAYAVLRPPWGVRDATVSCASLFDYENAGTQRHPNCTPCEEGQSAISVMKMGRIVEYSSMTSRLSIFALVSAGLAILGVPAYYEFWKPATAPSAETEPAARMAEAADEEQQSNWAEDSDTVKRPSRRRASLEKNGAAIAVDSPLPNTVVAESPLSIYGQARGTWYFEGDFPVKLVDDNGFLLGSSTAQATADWMTKELVPFSVKLAFALPSTSKGRLILSKDNPSGKGANAAELSVPVRFAEAANKSDKSMAVRIFLSHERFINEPPYDCSRTAAVERRVPKTTGVGKAAVEALLRGPTEEEAARGLNTQINPGVRLRSLSIEEGTAKVDFDERLQYQVGGSCRVTAIRAQITDTLKQFPTVEEVEISVNGKSKYILQP